MMARFVERAEAGCSLTMILRSAAADPAKALIGMKGALQRVGVRARVIVARLEPENDLRQLFAGLTELAPQQPAFELIRWLRNPRLLEAHEQATYGQAMCWWGDAMRRDAERRNALAMFEEDASDQARFGRLAFESIWVASSPVPERRLVASATARPYGAFEQAPEEPVAVSPQRPRLQGWPLVRH
jgi:hypothetical protein